MVIIFMRETGSICSTCLSKLCLRERVLSHILYMILHASPRDPPSVVGTVVGPYPTMRPAFKKKNSDKDSL